MSRPYESVIAIRLLAAVGIVSAHAQVIGRHQEPSQAKGNELSLLSVKASRNENLMEKVWGPAATAAYRAWKASPHSPSLVSLDTQASAAYSDWKASKDVEALDMSGKQPSDVDSGVAVAEASGSGRETAESSHIGRDAAQDSGIGKQKAQDAGTGKLTAEENFLGRKTAAEHAEGQIAAREEGVGRVAAMKAGHGREIAIAHRSGVHTAKAMGIGNAEVAGEATCFPAVNVTDAGYSDEFRGWFDIQECGQCNDYCRWVGSGSGGDPSQSQSKNGAFWSCQLSGATDAYTPQDHFASWMHPRCDGRGLRAPCMEPQAELEDTGFTDAYQGWYDVQGCGVCNDYCRWVGRSGSGGDPKNRLAKGDSWWSCQLAGHSLTHTNLGRFGQWSLPRCDGRGAPAPEPSTHRLITEPPPLTVGGVAD